MNLPSLPQDKANHALYGAVIALVGVLIAKLLSYPQAAAGLLLCVVFAVLKEASDAYQNHRQGKPVHGVELLDAVATVAGGVIVCITVLVSGK